MPDPTSDQARLAALEAQQQQLLGLLARLVAASERTAAALDHLTTSSPAPTSAPLRLVR